MSLRRLFVLCFSALILGISALGVVGVQMIANEDRMNGWHELRYRSYLLADELRQSSDDLTRLARLYVVTKNPMYETAYFEVLAIRNGEQARPKAYHRIYWDLVLDLDQRPRGRGEKVPLHELMRRAGFIESEFDLVRQAQANSDELVQAETVAMNAVKGLGPDGAATTEGLDPEMPVRVMHDAAYMRNKARIMEPIDGFLASVEARTAAEVSRLVSRGRHLLVANLGLVAVLLALAVGFGLAVPRAIFRQVGGEPRMVEGAVRRIADGDLTVGLGADPAHGSRGIRAAMAEMAGRLRGVVAQVVGSAGRIASQSLSVDGSATDLAGAAAEQAQATHEASASMHQIVAAIASTAEHAARTGALARSAAQNARTTGRAVAETVGSMRAVVERVGVIGEFARRTRILSLNAAIEAARARSGGRGFAVVAAEVRALAERSEQAAGEIDVLVANALEVAERACSLLDRLVPTIEETSALVQQIGEDGRQQSAGAHQIQIALDQIEKVARRDSVASSELLELARDLAEQASSLDGAMSYFRLPPTRDRG